MGLFTATTALSVPIHEPVAGAHPLAPSLDFDAFYEAHVDFVWRVARRLGVPSDRVDDAVQDVFVVVHRRMAELDPRVPLRAWLFRVVQNVAREHRRKARRGDCAPLPEDLADGGSDPERSALRGEEIALVDRLVRALPEERRAVFILAECEQMTAPEIAEALEVNLNTVYTRLRLARADFEAALTRLRRTAR